MNKLTLIACLLACILQIAPTIASAQSRDDWTPSEMKCFAQAKRTVESTRIHSDAKVSAINKQANGSTMIDFHSKSREYHLNWTESERPIPWIVGQNVTLGIREGEIVHVAMKFASPYKGDSNDSIDTVMSVYYHYVANGEVELLVATPEKHWILVRPNKLGEMSFYGISIDWIKGLGIVMTQFEAGDGEFEVEDLTKRAAGFTPVNAPGIVIKPGRGGWKSLQDLDSVQPENDDYPIERYRKLVPLPQRIRSAG